MKILFDTNIVLDVLLEREPHVDASARLFSLVDNGRIHGMICATTVTTIFYIASKSFGGRRAREQVHGLLELFDIAPVNRDVLASALAIGFPDYEDAVLHEAAREADAAAIVTRDNANFARATIPALHPKAMLAVIAANK